MTALAVSSNGLPLGIIGQKFWVREKRSQRSEHGRPNHGGESAFWREILDECQTSFLKESPETTPWYQIDRGGDCWQLLTYAADSDLLVTVRATHDRRLDDAGHLWPALECARVRAKTVVEVAARPPGPGGNGELPDGEAWSWHPPVSHGVLA